MKKIILLLFFCLSSSLFAQNYYEIPYVGTNSILKKLNNKEKKDFIINNKIPTFYNERKDSLSENTFLDSDYCEKASLVAIYREEVPNEYGEIVLTAYRCMYSFNHKIYLNLEKNNDSKIIRNAYGQVIYLQEENKYKEYFRSVYFGDEGFSRNLGYGILATNIQFRIDNNNLYSFFTKIATYNNEYWTENIIYKTNILTPLNKNIMCKIDINYPIIDSNNPFKYTIQNAFDGDKKTCYMVNSNDNSFEINIDFLNYLPEYKIDIPYLVKIINGNSENINSYIKYNRIKTIEHDIDKNENPITYICTDKILDFQEFYISNPTEGWLWLNFLDTYKAENLSNTCISELNIKFKYNNWLFREKK